ncbi:MAG: TerC family protein [Planctomycetota bacterium]
MTDLVVLLQSGTTFWSGQIWLYTGFILFVLAMLALDLGVFNRQAHVIGTREALKWTAVCVGLAALFSGVVYFIYEHHWLGIGLDVPHHNGVRENLGGMQAMLLFITGYLIEYTLSMDNIFVIAIIFGHFRVPPTLQHRVLFWGVLGALVMRGVMIAAGAAVISNLHWIIYVFGGLLVVTAVKMLIVSEKDVEVERTWAVRLARRIFPFTPEYDGERFFTVLKSGALAGRRAMTPLFLTLIVVEVTDLIFAVDSIPAIFAITLDPFIVFTSNIFAILGLRSLYFALAGLMNKFAYLQVSLAFVLLFVGLKMLLAEKFEISPLNSLSIIVAILMFGIFASIYVTRRNGGGKPAE